VLRGLPARVILARGGKTVTVHAVTYSSGCQRTSMGGRPRAPAAAAAPDARPTRIALPEISSGLTLGIASEAQSGTGAGREADRLEMPRFGVVDIGPVAHQRCDRGVGDAAGELDERPRILHLAMAGGVRAQHQHMGRPARQRAE